LERKDELALPEPFISVVIPCHNGAPQLRLTLESLELQNYPHDRFEVIVVDQASSDGSRDIVRQLNPDFDLRLITQDRKFGPSIGRNAGAEAARGSILLFLDADQVTHPRLLQAHTDFHARRADAIACGQVLPYEPAYLSFIERSARAENYQRGDVERELPFHDVWSNHLSMPADVYRQVGPFSPELKAYEDVEFAYRADWLGFKGYLCPQAISYHNHPRSLAERLATARKYKRVVPQLLKAYPGMAHQLPQLKTWSEIDLHQDSFKQLYGKLRIRFFALSPIRAIFLTLLNRLDHLQRWPWVTKALFWRLLQAEEYLGFQEGKKALSGKN
jgi:glycosyltransferase AglI